MLRLEHLAELGRECADVLGHVQVKSCTLRGRTFQPYPSASLMGVINLSPDSWYRESVALNVESAVRRGIRLLAEGADILDLGAESTIPGTERVDVEAQLQRLRPVLDGLAQRDALVSVETYSADVAEATLKAGAAIINLTGNQESEATYRAVAKHAGAVIICFVGGARNVREVGELLLDGDTAEQLLDYFETEIELALTCGVRALWIDPGMGFYYRNLTDGPTRVRYQMQTFLNTFRLARLGWPVCHALPHAFEFFEDEVRSAEAFFAVLASLGKTSLFRTHEVAKVRGVLRTLASFDH